MSEQEVIPAPEVIKEAEAKVAKAKKSKKKAPRAGSRPLGHVEITSKDYDRVILPSEEDDPHWDSKLKNPVPEAVIDSLAEFGWGSDSRAVAIYAEDKGDKLKIIHGKTRWRALEKVNKARKNDGLDPIVAQLTIVDEDPSDIDSVIRNMRLNVIRNFAVQDIDPMTKAESIYRALSSGQDEKTVAKDHKCSVNDLHGYQLILDDDKCPEAIRDMLRNGTISFNGALELARKADQMTKGEMVQAAEQIAKAAAGGLKVTAAQVRKAAGVETDGPATQKQRKQFILDLQSGEIDGKFGHAVTWAAIVASEVGLGSRTVDSAWAALGKLGKGEQIRVDFKQYQGEKTSEPKPAEPVKGQDKKTKKK